MGAYGSILIRQTNYAVQSAALRRELHEKVASGRILTRRSVVVSQDAKNILRLVCGGCLRIKGPPKG